MTKNKIIVGSIILVVLFIVLVGIALAIFWPSGGNGGGSIGNKYKWYCDVAIQEKFITNPFDPEAYIDGLYCQNTEKRCLGLFGIWTAEGTIEMWDSTGIIGSENYETDSYHFLTGIFAG